MFVIKKSLTYKVKMSNQMIKRASEYGLETLQSHTIQTNPRHQKKVHRTLTVSIHQEDSQIKAASFLFPIKMIAKQGHNVLRNKTRIKHRALTNNGAAITKNKQQQSHRLRMDNSLSYWGEGGGVNAFYWYQIFAL